MLKDSGTGRKFSPSAARPISGSSRAAASRPRARDWNSRWPLLGRSSCPSARVRLYPSALRAFPRHFHNLSAASTLGRLVGRNFFEENKILQKTSRFGFFDHLSTTSRTTKKLLTPKYESVPAVKNPQKFLTPKNESVPAVKNPQEISDTEK